MLKTRLITSILLMLMLLGSLYLFSDIGWALVTLIVVVMGAWEWAALARLGIQAKIGFTGLFASFGMLMMPGVWPLALENFQFQILFWGLIASVLFWLVLAPLWLLRLCQIKHTALLLACGVLVLLASWMSLVYLRKVSPSFLLALMATVWIADSAAYFAGKQWGKHKLAPQISPGKTWEGVIGAWIAVTIYGVVLCIILKLSFWILPGLWVLLILSIVGDLFESHLKRQIGAKDSGHILPGHGGVLDRIDGMISTLPIMTFVLHFPIYYQILSAGYL